MRRLIIIRKDLNLSSGKLMAMSMHLAEAYWTNILKTGILPWKKENELGQQLCYTCNVELPIDIVDEYVFGIFTKTVCEAKNLNDLKKVENYIEELNRNCLVECQAISSAEKLELEGTQQGSAHMVMPALKKKLVEGVDWGYINDKCLTDLTPENPDGTTTVGVWFKPLPDDIAHKISKKYKLYKDKTKFNVYSVICNRKWTEGEDSFTVANYTSRLEAEKHLKFLFSKLSESKESTRT